MTSSFRTRHDDGRVFPTGQMQRSLYGPPRDKVLAKNIRGHNQAQAIESTRYLSERWQHARSRAEMRKLVWAANQEANRLTEESRNPRVHPDQRRRAKEAGMVYRAWVEAHRLTPKAS